MSEKNMDVDEVDMDQVAPTKEYLKVILIQNEKKNGISWISLRNRLQKSHPSHPVLSTENILEMLTELATEKCVAHSAGLFRYVDIADPGMTDESIEYQNKQIEIQCRQKKIAIMKNRLQTQQLQLAVISQQP
jgi:hypothetical protein